MSKKLQNIKALQKMLAGEHRTQTKKTFSFGVKPKVPGSSDKYGKNPGDVWIGEDGVRRLMLHGGGIVRNPSQESIDDFHLTPEQKQDKWNRKTFWNCPQEICTCTVQSKADKLLARKIGMCLDCNVKMETQLQIKGQFDQYAKKKMFENVKSYIRDMEQQFEEWEASMKSAPVFVNDPSAGDGQLIEKWVETGNNQIVIDKMRKELEEMKEMLLKNYDPDREIRNELDSEKQNTDTDNDLTDHSG